MACAFTHTEIWRSSNGINLQPAPADKIVMKNQNGCQALGQITAVHFLDLNPNFNGTTNIMKFGLHASTKVKFNAIDQSQKNQV